jgi:branched-chain amino acid aminotransferase
MYINHNGFLLPARQAVLTAGNRGFRYGDGLFESMRYMKGELRFAEWHADRLQRGMTALKMEGSEAMTGDFLRERSAELVVKNRLGANARLRMTVYRESGGLYSPETNASGYIAEATRLDENVYKGSSPGFIAEIYPDMSKAINILSNYKTCNSLLFVMAGIFRKENSLDEVIILNSRGFLCEALTSNVFVAQQGKLYTPALAEGCIDGVMRRGVIQLARRENITVEEGRLHPGILNTADEVFITNAARGIQWIMGIGTKRYFNKMSKFLLTRLNETEF